MDSIDSGIIRAQHKHGGLVVEHGNKERKTDKQKARTHGRCHLHVTYVDSAGL